MNKEDLLTPQSSGLSAQNPFQASLPFTLSLTPSHPQVNKEDLLNMVRYGAELVFSSEASNITDADIDAILSKVRSGRKALGCRMCASMHHVLKWGSKGV